VRYHLRRQPTRWTDVEKPHKAAALHGAIVSWLGQSTSTAINLVALHAWFVEEHAFQGSARSVQRYVRAALPPVYTTGYDRTIASGARPIVSLDRLRTARVQSRSCPAGCPSRPFRVG